MFQCECHTFSSSWGAGESASAAACVDTPPGVLTAGDEGRLLLVVEGLCFEADGSTSRWESPIEEERCGLSMPEASVVRASGKRL